MIVKSLDNSTIYYYKGEQSGDKLDGFMINESDILNINWYYNDSRSYGSSTNITILLRNGDRYKIYTDNNSKETLDKYLSIILRNRKLEDILE